MNITFHYPPELLQLLIDTIPRLCRSKEDVLLFLKGAGVGNTFTSEASSRVHNDRENINKFEIVRAVLTRLNERGESALRERREVLRRVVEFDDFSTCWPNDELKAKGLVSEIRRVTDVKDSFTRMQQEREAERRERLAAKEAEAAAAQSRKATLESTKRDLYALFGESNRHKRGKLLESVMNRLFKGYEILVREAFTLTGADGEGIVEQIDGVIEIDGHLYFVETKWWQSPVGVPEIAEHMMRVFLRAEARAIILSGSNFTAPAVAQCREALTQKVVALCSLQELVTLLDRGLDLRQFLKCKVNAAIANKNPFHDPISAGEL